MRVRLGVTAYTYPNGESLSDVMAYNHFGSPTIPPRPVLRIAAENYLSSDAFKIAMKAYIQNVKTYMKTGQAKDLQRAEKELLRKMGVGSITEAKRIIMAVNELQENAPMTIAKKGKNHPLYETGEMLKHLSYDYEE